MRTRGPNPFPWASAVTTLPNQPPVAVPWAQAIKWYHRVRTWAVSAHVVDNTGTDVCKFTGSIVYWNRQNNTDLPGTFTVPTDEQELAIGWQIDAFLADPSATNFSVSLFVNSPATTLGANGIQYSDPASDTFPFLDLSVSGGATDNIGGSGVVVTIDGIVVPFTDSAGLNLWTGFITMDPDTFWENRKSDGSAPVWTAAGVQLLDPHQTDELPSSS